MGLGASPTHKTLPAAGPLSGRPLFAFALVNSIVIAIAAGGIAAVANAAGRGRGVEGSHHRALREVFTGQEASRARKNLPVKRKSMSVSPRELALHNAYLSTGTAVEPVP